MGPDNPWKVRQQEGPRPFFGHDQLGLTYTDLDPTPNNHMETQHDTKKEDWRFAYFCRRSTVSAFKYLLSLSSFA